MESIKNDFNEVEKAIGNWGHCSVTFCVLFRISISSHFLICLDLMFTVTGYWRSWGSGHCNAYLNTNFFAEHSTLCSFYEWMCSPSRSAYMDITDFALGSLPYRYSGHLVILLSPCFIGLYCWSWFKLIAPAFPVISQYIITYFSAPPCWLITLSQPGKTLILTDIAISYFDLLPYLKKNTNDNKNMHNNNTSPYRHYPADPNGIVGELQELSRE